MNLLHIALAIKYIVNWKLYMYCIYSNMQMWSIDEYWKKQQQPERSNECNGFIYFLSFIYYYFLSLSLPFFFAACGSINFATKAIKALPLIEYFAVMREPMTRFCFYKRTQNCLSLKWNIWYFFVRHTNVFD